MKKTFIGSCILAIASLGLFLTGCKEDNKPTDPSVIEVEILVQTDTEISARFTPNAATKSFEIALGERSMYEVDDFIAGDVPGTITVEMSDLNGNSYYDYTWRVVDEKFDTKEAYHVFARGKNAAGDWGSVADKLAQPAVVPFDVKTQYVSDVSAGFQFNLSQNIYHFAYNFGESGRLDEFINGDMENNVTMNECFRWTANYFDLEPDTDYSFYAQGYYRNGKETDPMEIKVHTYPEGSNEIVNFEFINNKGAFDMQYYTVIPNDLCNQIVLVNYPKGEQIYQFEPNSYASDILLWLDSWKNSTNMDFIPSYTANDGATLEAKVDTSNENGPYEVYVVGMDLNNVPAIAKRFYVDGYEIDETLPLPTKGNFDFTIRAEDYDTIILTIECDMSEETHIYGYYMDLIDMEWFRSINEETGKPNGEDIDNIRTQLLNGGVLVEQEVLQTDYNFNTEAGGGWKEEGEYAIVVIPVNTNGPGEFGWGEMELSPSVNLLPMN